MKKYLLFFVMTILLIGVLVNNFLKKSEKEDIENLGKEAQVSIRTNYNSALNAYKLVTKDEHFYIQNDKKFIELLRKFKSANFQEKQTLRGELYRHFAKHYKNLKKMNFRQFHFHDNKGNSLLRFHLPYLNGDNLIDLRHSIKVANVDLKEIMGFEGGRIFPGFRYVYPIIDKKEHLGSVEYSVSFEAIEKIMKKIYPDITYHIHIDKSVSVDKVFKWYKDYFLESIFNNGHYIENLSLSAISNKVKKDPLINSLNKLVKNTKNFNNKFKGNEDFTISTMYNNETYLVTFLNIKSTTNKHAGYLVSYQKNNHILEIQDKYSIFYALLYMTIILLGFLAYIILYQVDKIIVQKKRLEKTNIKQVETIIQQKNELESIFNTTNDIITIIDFDSNILFFNNAFKEITPFTKEEIDNKKWHEFFSKNNISTYKVNMIRIKKERYINNIKMDFIAHENKKRYLNISMALMSDKKRVLIFAKDISEVEKKDKLIKDYVNLIDLNIITATTNLKGIVTDVSTAFCLNTGYSKDELIGGNLSILRHPDAPREIYEDLWKTISSNKIWKGELLNLKKDGTSYWVSLTINAIYDENNKKIAYTAIKQDITDKKLIEEISIKDGLTNIYNRRHFNNIFPKLVNSSKRNRVRLYFIMMDIDYFKQYNDTYGHQKGDEVLVLIAKTLKNIVKRADDYAFRLGGEEFGIIFNSKDNNSAISFANKILKIIADLKIEHNQSKVSSFVSVSAGLISILDEKINDEITLYKKSDELLYKAKEKGRNQVCSNIEDE